MTSVRKDMVKVNEFLFETVLAEYRILFVSRLYWVVSSQNCSYLAGDSVRTRVESEIIEKRV